MAADNLRNLAIEQTGGIGHERLASWMFGCVIDHNVPIGPGLFAGSFGAQTFSRHVSYK